MDASTPLLSPLSCLLHLNTHSHSHTHTPSTQHTLSHTLPYTALHEDIERLERVIVKDFKRDMRVHREKLMQSHRVKRRLESTEDASRKLVRGF